MHSERHPITSLSVWREAPVGAGVRIAPQPGVFMPTETQDAACESQTFQGTTQRGKPIPATILDLSHVADSVQPYHHGGINE